MAVDWLNPSTNRIPARFGCVSPCAPNAPSPPWRIRPLGKGLPGQRNAQTGLFAGKRSPSSRFMASAPALIDRHGRTISYLRLSVTDRCDLRCRYCMAERMTFLPRDRLLSLEEIAIIAERFIARGVTKIRLTGGEPLVRRDVTELAHRLGRHLGCGLDELTMTTKIGRAHV